MEAEKKDGEKYDVKQTLSCLPLQLRLGRTQVSGLKSIYHISQGKLGH